MTKNFDIELILWLGLDFMLKIKVFNLNKTQYFLNESEDTSAAIIQEIHQLFIKKNYFQLNTEIIFSFSISHK